MLDTIVKVVVQINYARTKYLQTHLTFHRILGLYIYILVCCGHIHRFSYRIGGNMTALGRKVSRYCENNGLTQKEFAEKLGIKPWEVSAVRSGKVNGRNGGQSAKTIRGFFNMMELQREIPWEVPAKKHLTAPVKQSKLVTKKELVYHDPLSLRLVEELKMEQRALWWLVVICSAILAILIVMS